MTKFEVLLLAGLALAALQPALAVDAEKVQQMTAIVESLFSDVRAALEHRFLMDDLNMCSLNCTLSAETSAVEIPVKNKVPPVLKIPAKVTEDVKNATTSSFGTTWGTAMARSNDLVAKTGAVAQVGVEAIRNWSCNALDLIKYYGEPVGSYVVRTGKTAGETAGRLLKAKFEGLLTSASTIEVPPDSALQYDD